MPMFKKRDRLASVASIAANKGLLNEPGENNCFLNSAIQVLWHLDVFRRSFRLLHGHACMGASCIFCALKDIFQQFQHSKAQALPPNVLRSALAETFQQQNRFQLGYMDDAAECFENILLRMHVHLGNNMREDVCTAKHCISHQKFGLSLVEQCVCQCGATSEPLPFIEMVHYVSATALCAEDEFIRRKYGPSVTSSFGRLIRDAESWGERKNCPSDCGARVNMRKVLMNCPDVVSVGIIWDSEEPQVQNISDLVHSLGTTLRLSDLFHTVVDERASLMDLYLVGMVCYYGKHYSTFFFHTKLRKWVYFDDAQVSEVGKRWSNVVSKCIKGHHQPLLLLYANPDGKPINNATAPNEISLLPGCIPVNGAGQYDRVILSNIKEADSLSSEGEVTSFADEESSGTESMQATTIVSPPPSRTKPKSKSRDDFTQRLPVEQPAVVSTEKRQPRAVKTTNVKPENRNITHKPLTPEVVPVKEKQPKKQPKTLPITVGQVKHKAPVTNQTAPVPVKKNFEEKPVESSRKPTFQWNMASEKPRASNGVKVGEYKEPQPAQWTKYKPYPQANKANERRPRTTVVTDGRKSPQSTPLDLEVKSMDSKGMATFALARKSSNTDSASSTTTMQQQRTPPMSQAGDRAIRRSPVSKLRRTSQNSDNSSMSGISMSSSQPESLSSNRQHSNSPVLLHNTTSGDSPESSGMQNTNTNNVSPQGGSTCQGAAHEITNCLPTTAATNCQQGTAKPPLPRKPPFLSIPFSASTPPTPNLATVTTPHAYPTMHPNQSPQTSNSNPATFPNTQANAAAQILSLANRMQRLNGVSSNSPHSNPPERVNPKSEKAELLLREAEERFEQSRQADNLLDYSTALQLCLEATKMVEVVLLMEDVPTDCMVQARIKHGECVNKARILQRRKNIRMQARGKEAGGNRSSMTEADRHMNQSEDATSSTSVTSLVKGHQLQEEDMSAVKELEKEDENLINFNKAGMTNLQHQVNQIYEHHNQVRQHPDYRPHAGLRPPHGPNSNNSNNNSSTSLSSAKSQHPEKRASSSSSQTEESDESRTKIFVWKRPEDEEDVVEMIPQRSALVSAVEPRGIENPASKSNSLPRRQLNSSSSSLPRGVNPPSGEDHSVHDNNARRNPHPASSSVDNEIQENMKLLSMNPTHRFRSKTPTPQGASEMSVGQQRRSKTPTPISNKEMMRARMGTRSHGELPRPRPKSAYGSASEMRKEDSDSGVSSRKLSDKSSSGTNSPTSERPTSAMGAPYAYPGWTPANHMMPMGFNPAMLSPNFYPYMMDMWQYYNNMTPEQKNLFAANMQNHKPPTFPVSTPMTAPPAMKAAYLESLKLQLGRNLTNFTNNVNQLPPSRNVNTNIYEQNKPRPIAKSDQGSSPSNEVAPGQVGPSGRAGPNGPGYPPGQTGPAGRGNRQAPNRRPPMGLRPDASKYGRSNDVIPSRGHPAPQDPGRERRRPPGDSPGASVPPQSLPPSKQPPDDRQRVNHQQQQGMMKWAEEAKKRNPGPGIPPQFKDKIIQDFRSRRGNPQFASTSAVTKNVAKPTTNGAPPPVDGDKQPHNCELCGLVKVECRYCDSCKAYLSRFKPTVNSRRGAIDKA